MSQLRFQGRSVEEHEEHNTQNFKNFKCRVLLLLEVLHIVEEGVMFSEISTC